LFAAARQIIGTVGREDDPAEKRFRSVASKDEVGGAVMAVGGIGTRHIHAIAGPSIRVNERNERTVACDAIGVGPHRGLPQYKVERHVRLKAALGVRRRSWRHPEVSRELTRSLLSTRAIWMLFFTTEARGNTEDRCQLSLR